MRSSTTERHYEGVPRGAAFSNPLWGLWEGWEFVRVVGLWVAVVLALALSLTVGAAPMKAAGSPGGLEIHFINVGQGDSTLLLGPDFTILIDAGRHDRDDVVPYLKSVGVERIDLLVGTHPHSDHIGQFPNVLAAFPVVDVWLSGDVHTTRIFEATLDAILASDAGYHEPRAGEVYTLGSARIEVVHPQEVTGDLNNGSIAMRVTYGDVSILFTGDAEIPSELEMIRRGHDLSAHILHIGHHGSRTATSRELLEAVQPEVAIYSAGLGNEYGHPHAEVIERLVQYGVTIYGTDVHGTIKVTTDGSGYIVSVERTPEGPTHLDRIASQGGCAPGQININTASQAELTRIVHIGEARAAELISRRPYRSLDDLLRIPGIGQGRLGDIKKQGLACVDAA